MNQQDTGKEPEGGFLDAPEGHMEEELHFRDCQAEVDLANARHNERVEGFRQEELTIECPAVIWKYPFQVSDTVEIEMPREARILHVDAQHGTPCLWVLVDPASERVTRRLRVFGTGHPISGTLGRHVGTFQQQAFVWHVFEWESL